MVDDATPIIVGAGQFAERLDAADYQGLSAVEIAAAACRQAIADAGGAQQLASLIDYIATTRTFEDSAPHLAFPFGRSNNFPRSICARLGIQPRHAIWEHLGGNTPQQLVSEACERIATGEFRLALLTGAEAISTARHLQKQGAEVDWSETLDEQVEDRFDASEEIAPHQALIHGLWTAPMFYGLCENARRAGTGLGRDDYRQQMAQWFAPFTAVAARNPYASMANREYTAGEIATVDAQNRLIADPYTRLMVARDQVNQGAALLVTSVGLARELGIDESRWIYLHGYAAASEREFVKRPDLGDYPAATAVAKAALEAAGRSVDEIDVFDLYSCFPIAVSAVAESLGLSPDDPRGFTVTGGLPYFGGPGNNYSMHGIASMVERLRAAPMHYGLVGANGGMLSKYAAGIYSARPRGFTPCPSKDLQAGLDAVPTPGFSEQPTGRATVETYTLNYGRDGRAEHAVVVGRLTACGSRFLAATETGDVAILERMQQQDALGAVIDVVAGEQGNRFSFA